LSGHCFRRLERLALLFNLSSQQGWTLEQSSLPTPLRIEVWTVHSKSSAKWGMHYEPNRRKRCLQQNDRKARRSHHHWRGAPRSSTAWRDPHLQLPLCAVVRKRFIASLFSAKERATRR
jgi:hypothetical protein